jgi:branched-chain amino acid transport system permease protein
MGFVNFFVYLAIMMGIYGILSLSLNLQYGFTGLANFGQVAFFCLGAYISTIIVFTFDMPFIFGLMGGMVVAGILFPSPPLTSKRITGPLSPWPPQKSYAFSF